MADIIDVSSALALIDANLNADVSNVNSKNDETACTRGYCCHPTCWDSRRRQVRGLPRRLPQISPRAESEPCMHENLNGYTDDGVPRLAVQNLLEEYGESPTDRFPSGSGGSVLLDKYPTNQTQSGFPATNVPHASPISGSRSRSLVHPPNSAPPRLHPIEIQEVFDADEISQGLDQSNHVPYYIWAPNPHRKRRKKKSSGPTVQQLSGAPIAVAARDYTEDLLPRELTNPQFESRTSRRASPVRMSRATNSRLTTRSGSRSLHSRVRDLRDVPRGTLSQVLHNMEQSGTATREGISRVLTELTETTDAQLVRQKQLQLLPERSRYSSQEPLPAPYRLDNRLADLPPEALALYTRSQALRGTLPEPADLPNMKGSHVPLVALGLPEIPSGVRYVRPFYYRRAEDLDFTLERVPSLVSSSRSSHTRVNTPESSNRVLTSDQSRGLQGGPPREVSASQLALHVRVPTDAEQTTVAAGNLTYRKSDPGNKTIQEGESIEPEKTTEEREGTAKIPRIPPNTPYTAHVEELEAEKDTPIDVAEKPQTSQAPRIKSATTTTSTAPSETWPQVDEEALRTSPRIELSIPSAHVGGRSDSVTQESMSSVSGDGGTRNSPAPPPPSPDLKQHKEKASETSERLATYGQESGIDEKLQSSPEGSGEKLHGSHESLNTYAQEAMPSSASTLKTKYDPHVTQIIEESEEEATPRLTEQDKTEKPGTEESTAVASGGYVEEGNTLEHESDAVDLVEGIMSSAMQGLDITSDSNEALDKPDQPPDQPNEQTANESDQANQQEDEQSNEITTQIRPEPLGHE